MIAYSSYSTSPTQKQSFYANDMNGIIFEFTAFNLSDTLTTLPTFEIVSGNGFNNVSAIAAVDISATSLNNLFYFEGNSYSNNTTIIPVMYGINTSFTFNVSYSKSILTYGAINSIGPPPLKSDYINYLAYAITGGYNLANIFSNEDVLLQGVTNMDTSFNNTINDSISKLNVNYSTVTSKTIDISNVSVFFDNDTNQSFYIQGCKTLLDGLLSIPSTTRGEQFLTDIENQNNDPINANSSSSPTSYYYIKFHPGDVVSVLLNYVPYNGNASSIIGDNLVYTRSYKILLNCT